MKKYIKTISLGLLAVVFALASTGCSSKKTPTASNSITVWGFDDPDVFKPIIRDFQKQFSGSTVTYAQKSLNSEYEIDSLNAISAGQGPDVWTIPNNWITRHADKLVPYTATKPGKDELSKVDAKSYFVPVVTSGATLDGKLYGLTPAVDTLRVYYNPALLDQAYASFEKANKGNKEYIAKVKAIVDKGPLFWDDYITLKTAFGGPVIALGTANNVSVADDIFYLLMLQNKSKLFSDDMLTAIFNLPSKTASGEDVVVASKALDFYTSFANPLSPNFVWGTNQPQDVDAFVNGQVMMTVNYLSYSLDLMQRYPTFKYKMFAMPQVLTSTNNDITDFARFDLMTVPWLSKNQSLAWSFAKYASSIGQKTYISATKKTPSVTKKDDEQVVMDRQSGNPDSFQKFTASTLSTSSRWPAKFDAIFAEAISKVNSGELTSQKALDAASDKITQLLRNKGY